MKKGIILLILSAVMAIMFSIFGPAAAQNIDIENMDNAQLMQLLQQIMQQLNNNAEETVLAEAAEKLPDPTAAAAEEEVFSIYKNKKLFLERIPDDQFIRENSDKDPQKTPGTPGKKDDHGCDPGCQYECWINVYGRPECGCACG